jgi:type IV pilus assembly protein PilC
MKYDEFSFFNQQLAAMLRDGIPLEGALKRLCAEMRHGALRDELQKLEADLARGTPIAEALKGRQLPELYKRMVMVGVKSGDLPGALTMLAEYFQQQENLWTRMKGLMVYPLIVLIMAFLLSCFLAYILGAFIWNNLESLVGSSSTLAVPAGLWMSPVILGLALVGFLIAVLASPAREHLRWRLPAFREASLSRVAAGMWLMLKSGVQFDDALALVEQLEKGTCAEAEIAGWRRKLASGAGRFSQLATPGQAFPPLFIWTVAQSGEDLTAGFQRAAGLYQGRAVYRTELMLYSLLPCSILALGAMLVAQYQPVFAALMAFIRNLSGDMG